MAVSCIGVQQNSAILVARRAGDLIVPSIRYDDARVGKIVGDVGVQLNSDVQRIGNRRVKERSSINSCTPALQLDVAHHLGNALGTNHLGVYCAGLTRLRLRHAAARHGEQYEHDEAAFQYCFVSLHLLLLKPIRVLF